MSILDRVTKAVGDAVDRGKKEVDQFVKIQKVSSQIGDCERKISHSKTQIQQIMMKIGEQAVEMLRAGTLSSTEMQTLLDQINGFEKQISAEEVAIVEKRAEIERIRAEAKTDKSAGIASPEPTSATAAPSNPAPAGHVCPQCGAQSVQGGAFCTQCGVKLI
jgi:hypothetical protein